MSLKTRALKNGPDVNTTSLTASQNRAVLIAALVCASVSLLVTFITLRWFILMKKTFRHRLVLLLICSDTFKAIWYFVFPVVVFSRGPVASSSTFCQASGFFFALGIEMADFAILGIALHSIIYIFKPPTRSGESGGLYRWRKWIYPVWLGFPLLLASLAFINNHHAYTTAGSLCYLPRRPFWYRLALAWIPRYMILCLIFAMYATVYIYVTLKFRSFSNLNNSDDDVSGFHSHESSSTAPEIAADDKTPAKELDKRTTSTRPGWSRSGSYRNEVDVRPSDPWDAMSFITAKPLRNTGSWQPGVQTSDFASVGNEQNNTPERSALSRNTSFRVDPLFTPIRKVSACPTTGSSFTGDTVTAAGSDLPPNQQPQPMHKQVNSPQPKPKDPLKRTRSAIMKQLRYLFVYPAVYVLMWIFPFASHCLQYNDYYVQHPVFWLSVLQTCMLALQATADCAVFSWREQPWRRIPDDSKFAMKNIRNTMGPRKAPRETKSGIPFVSAPPGHHPGALENGRGSIVSGTSSRAASAHWWEAEGRRRKDSVWLGVDNNGISTTILERGEPSPLSSTPTVAEEDEEEFETTHRDPSPLLTGMRHGDTSGISTPNDHG